MKPPLPARLALLALLASTVALAACKSDPPAPPPPAASAAPSAAASPTPVDRVAPNEIPEGTERAFGFPFPRAMRVEDRFPDAVRARGALPFDAVANYVRARVVAERVETGPAKTVFPRATLRASPEKMLRVEVVAFGDRTEIFVRDVTRPSSKDIVKPTDPWLAPGFDPNDRKADPQALRVSVDGDDATYAPPRDERPPATSAPAAAPSYAKLAMLAALYFGQGLPFGYFTQVMPNLLRERGASLIVIGLSQAVAAPWALKFLWAPLVDRYGSPTFGRRKSWIVPLQAAMLALLVILAFSQTSSLTVFVAGVLAANFLAATQDIATDGLAIDILTPAERGFANGIQVGGYRAGMILGGSAVVLLLVAYGAGPAFLAMAALLATASLPVLFAKEPAAPPRPATAAEKDDVHFLRRPDAARILALVIAYKFGDAFATGMVRPFLKDTGFGLADQAVLLGTYGSVAGMLGALTGGALLVPLGRRRALVLFGAAQVVTMAAYAAAAAGLGGRPLVYAAVTTEHFVSGMATAALFAVMMDFCRPHRAATDYTVQASTFVIAAGAAQALGGVSAELFGYTTHFAAAAVLAAASVPAAFFLHTARERSPDVARAPAGPAADATRQSTP